MSEAARNENRKKGGELSLHPMTLARAFVGLGLTALLCSAIAADKVDVNSLPPPASTQIDYDRDIRPIFEHSCFRCHGPERPKSGFRLDLRESALKGGENGVDIVPGKSEDSALIHYVAHLVDDMEMPPKGKGDPLSATEIGLLRAWIDQGVPYGAPPKEKLSYAVTTGLRYISVSGDEKKFREHSWTREGFAGGLERLYLQDRTTNGVIVTTEARALFDESDYLLKLRLEKPDVGYVQAGVEQYRRYTDDTGIAFAGYPFGAPSLGNDPTMDVGRSWIEFGVTLPHWPRMSIGYEHQYRRGDKATTQYDFVSPDIAVDAEGKALLPTQRIVKEDVHIIKFDLDHEIAGIGIHDSFRGEFYNLDSTRIHNGVTVAGIRSGYNGAIEHDREDHFQGANAFTLEKQIRKWLFVSGGYLYSRLDGGAEFDRTIFVPVNPAAPSFLGEASNGILISQDAHAFNVSSLLGPWDGLSFYGGFQNEWMRQHSMAASQLKPTLLAASDPANGFSDISRMTFNETFGAKYTKIPATVLHVDLRWQQEYTDWTEGYLEGAPDSDHDFYRDTGSSALLQEYRGGVTVSPWTMVSWSADFKHRDKKIDYNHRIDFDYSADSGNGYPSFITSRDTITDSFETRLAIAPLNWFRTTLRYQLVSTDFHTATDPVHDVDPITGLPILVGGGPLLSGNYDANVYSINSTLRPWQRFYVSTTFVYSQSRIISGDNNGAQIVPYKGDIYSVISSATFVLSPKTDLNASYFYSRADYAQNNSAAGLPLGLAYDRHGLIAGLTHHWKPTLSTKLQYGFFKYTEPTSQGGNDYTAHAVFASMTYSLD